MDQPIGPGAAMFGNYLTRDPNWDYGNILPMATNRQTGEWSWAVPNILRSFLQGGVDLADAPSTGRMTPEATNTLSMLAGSNLLARPGGRLLTAAGPAPGEGNFLAYHGSPHSFDRFSTANIGTGEGAQAYGHGLYFAENEGVARTYRDILAYKHPGDAPPVDWNDPASVAGYWLKFHGGDKQAAIDYLEGVKRSEQPWLNTGRKANAEANIKVSDDAIQHLNDGTWTGPPNPGHMYQVNIAASPEHMLDWDKPISQQPPNVQAKIQNLANRGIGARNPDPAMTGGEWYVDATGAGHKSSDIAAHLHAPLPGEVDPAIPGIRYLDASSRAGGEGSHNYVVFNDSLISILKKYGIAGLFMGGGAAGAASGGGQSTE